MSPDSPVTPNFVEEEKADTPLRNQDGLGIALINEDENEENETMPSHRGLLGLYAVQVVASFDNALVLPSMYEYVRSLTSSERKAKWFYGLSQTVYFLFRVIGQLMLGQYLDYSKRQERIFRRTLSIGLGLGFIGSFLYFYSTIGGVIFILLARSILGSASAVTVASLSFVSRHVPKKNRTQLFSLLMGFQRASTPLAPLLVLGFDKANGKYFNSMTLPGILTGVFNLIALCIVLLFFDEPPPNKMQSNFQHTLEYNDNEKESACTILKKTGAYVSYFLSFQNNWNNQVVVWTLPLTTRTLYGADSVRDAFIFATGGFVGVCTAFFLSTRRSKYFTRDRNNIVFAQIGVGIFLIGFTLAHSHFLIFDKNNKIPLYITWIWFSLYYCPFIAQMPSNNSLYSKLISKQGFHNIGLLQSILEVSKSSARAFAGLAIGRAYATAGPLPLWLATLALWLAQFFPLFLFWNKLNPDIDEHISSLHKNLRSGTNLNAEVHTIENRFFQSEERELYLPLDDNHNTNLSSLPNNFTLELQRAQTVGEDTDFYSPINRIRPDAPTSPFIRVDNNRRTIYFPSVALSSWRRSELD
mmetsp:Transcript_17/g.30  ORF Transcript_17/g.30 Transcript_17/m.30 type:complete len:584 (-) Transcript_17:30-1781(-)